MNSNYTNYSYKRPIQEYILWFQDNMGRFYGRLNNDIKTIIYPHQDYPIDHMCIAKIIGMYIPKSNSSEVNYKFAKTIPVNIEEAITLVPLEEFISKHIDIFHSYRIDSLLLYNIEKYKEKFCNNMTSFNILKQMNIYRGNIITGIYNIDNVNIYVISSTMKRGEDLIKYYMYYAAVNGNLYLLFSTNKYLKTYDEEQLDYHIQQTYKHLFNSNNMRNIIKEDNSIIEACKNMIINLKKHYNIYDDNDILFVNTINALSALRRLHIYETSFKGFDKMTSIEFKNVLLNGDLNVYHYKGSNMVELTYRYKPSNEIYFYTYNTLNRDIVLNGIGSKEDKYLYKDQSSLSKPYIEAVKELIIEEPDMIEVGEADLSKIVEYIEHKKIRLSYHYRQYQVFKDDYFHLALVKVGPNNNRLDAIMYDGLNFTIHDLYDEDFMLGHAKEIEQSFKEIDRFRKLISTYGGSSKLEVLQETSTINLLY